MQKFKQALRGEAIQPSPIWFMRQAGRYLPEYRQVREQAGSFLSLCFNPELAAEVTLQPIRRYDLDAAILFADILLIPMVLGQELTFVAGEGPRLAPALIDDAADLAAVDGMDIAGMAKLEPVYETVRRVREKLPEDKSLIGFAGAPWTVATYMLAGRGSKDPSALRRQAYEQPERFDRLIGLIEKATTEYLVGQIEAGADAVQIFDSWASGLPPDFLRHYCLEPARRIAASIKERHPDVPVIVFPKGAGTLAEEFAKEVLFDGLGMGTETDIAWARKTLSPHVTVQGNLDPLLVVAGGKPMREAVARIKQTFEGVPHVFNLGHGFVPDTPPEHVAELVSLIRE